MAAVHRSRAEPLSTGSHAIFTRCAADQGHPRCDVCIDSTLRGPNTGAGAGATGAREHVDRGAPHTGIGAAVRRWRRGRHSGWTLQWIRSPRHGSVATGLVIGDIAGRSAGAASSCAHVAPAGRVLDATTSLKFNRLPLYAAKYIRWRATTRLGPRLTPRKISAKSVE